MLREEQSKEEAPIIHEERGHHGGHSAFTKMSILIGLVIVALLVLTVLLAVAFSKYLPLFDLRFIPSS